MLFNTYFAQLLIQNPQNQKTTTLNGKWHYNSDMYENGYYNYRYKPKDQKENPGSDAYLMNNKPKNRWDREE